MIYLESINKSLHNILDNNKDVIVIGEDILDPYGGAFKVTKGLSTAFPRQVISTPISEGAIVGSAVGMAMRGLVPIVEIIFGDFITLAMDQIINHATKYNWMYNEKVKVPLIIRLPVGGKRGYGPTHSQSLEALFMSVPGLQIISPSICHNPGEMLEEAIKNIEKPTIFVEYKIDYSKKLHHDKIGEFFITRDNSKPSNLTLSMYPDDDPDILIITYGGNLSIAIEAAEKMFLEEELLVNILVLSSLRPIGIDFIISNVEKCGKLILLEEGNKTGSWAAEISAIINENSYEYLEGPIKRIGSLDIPIPSSGPMERKMLPSVNSILNAMKDLI